MDGRSFDDLTRRLGAGATRRAGLRAALGGLIGMGLAALAPAGEADAKRKRKKQREVCGKPADPCDVDAACCGDGMCQSGQCCAAVFEPCTRYSDCCGFLFCEYGECVRTIMSADACSPA